MTDSPQWQPPSDFGRPTTPGSAPFASPTSAPGAPQPGSTGPTQPGQAWTPPPKPGLIALRPLTLGALLGASFQVLRRNPRPMFGFALLLTGIVSVVSLLVGGVIAVLAFGRLENVAVEDEETIVAGTVGAIVLSLLIPAALSIVTTAILQGIVALEVARGTLGERLKLGGLWRAARGRIGALVGWTLLLTAAALVLLILAGVVLGALVAFGGAVGLGLAVLFGAVATFGVAALGLWLGTRFTFVPSVLMLERLPLRAAVARSWSLTRGYFWRILGIQLLVAVIIQVVSSIISTPLSLVYGLTVGLTNPNGDLEATLISTIILLVVTTIVSLVYGAITAVVQSATAALLYIDTRMRKEGLDLELSRFVEARNAGDTTVVDPYLPRTPTA